MKRKIGRVFILIACLVYVQAALSDSKQSGSLGPDEELTGYISIVEPMENLLIVEKNSVPYNFKINSETRITVGMRHWPANLEDLEARKGHWVRVKFTPTSEGNIAREVAVGRGPAAFSQMHPHRAPSAMPSMCPMAEGHS
jgi:hypothetical protein